MQLFFGSSKTIGKKLVIYTVLFSSVITLFATAIQIYLDYRKDITQIEDNFYQVRSTYLSSLTENVWRLDDAVIKLQLDGLLKLPDVEYVAVQTDGDEVFSAGELHSKRFKKEIYTIEYVHLDQPYILGTLQIVAGLDALYARLRNKVFVILGSNAIKTFLVSLFILWMFHQLLGKHLRTMADYAESTGDETLDRPLMLDRPADREDELGVLTRAMNTMRVGLRDAIEDLKRTNTSLRNEIGAREDAEAALIRSEARLRAIITNTPSIIYIKDREGRFLMANSRLGEMLGMSPEEIEGRTVYELFDEEIAREHHAHDELVFADGESRTFDETAPREDGLHHYLSVKFPLFNAEGEIVSVAGISTDVTERKQIMEALRESEERFNTAMGAVKDGVWDWNLMTNDMFFSPRHYEMLGYESYEFPLTIDSWNSLIHPEDRDRAESVVNNYLSDVREQGRKDHFTLELRLKSKNGDWKWILTRGKATLVDEHGAPTRLIGTHVDITDRKRTEELIAQTEKMMSVGGLAAGMAHEINNPLAGILGAAQNLEIRLLNDTEPNRSVAKACGVSFANLADYMHKRQVPRMLQGIMESAIRAAETVRNMLSFSRKSEKQFGRHDVTHLLDSAYTLASNDFDLKKDYDFRKIKIERRYEADLPPVLCSANEIKQVFLNIFKNAAEAMAEKTYEHGEPRFILTAGREDGMVVVEIEDNGPGIDEVTKKRIFEPFYTTKSVGTGTGLGLSVSYFIIVDQHNGIIEAHSAPGEWTRFVIKLPLAT